MQLPGWLAGLTGARNFANNPATNFAPNWGDALQGIGHSMMQHYRGQGGKAGQSQGQLNPTNVPLDLGALLARPPQAPMRADAGDEYLMQRQAQRSAQPPRNPWGFGNGGVY